MEKRLSWGLAIAISYIACALIGMPLADSSFNPDTAGYLEFSPYRQPMYGIWANAAHAFFGSWHTVKVLQVGMFVASNAWVDNCVEPPHFLRTLGIISALAFAAIQL